MAWEYMAQTKGSWYCLGHGDDELVNDLSILEANFDANKESFSSAPDATQGKTGTKQLQNECAEANGKSVGHFFCLGVGKGTKNSIEGHTKRTGNTGICLPPKSLHILANSIDREGKT